MPLRFLALFLSYFFHPVALPALAFGCLFFLTPVSVLSLPPEYKWQLWSLIFLLTLAAPALGLLAFWLSGAHTGWPALPGDTSPGQLLLITLFYSLTTLLFATVGGFSQVSALSVVMGGITLTVSLLTLLQSLYNWCAQSATIGGLVGLLLGFNYRLHDGQLFWPIIALILLAGLVMSARLYLHRHTPPQVMSGAGLGFLANLVVIIGVL
ncbi:MAG: hypothetical protein HC913_02495 [Microscillaceae bacterium]|nr:hypothetical protein [Microscillaceae bacterium]